MKEREIVINRHYGGFGLSKKALELLGIEYSNDLPRDDERLVEVVKELGKEARSSYAELKIVSIPGDVEWEIDDYDGMETIREVHRTWC